ncbi:methyltransferase domain-containing protein [Microbacterium sp. KKR3/1]|uniref:methyltransferase domain-containing protein n=1 Tax=unclassified Microbacterium TaxID=2609290 RepID=UPI001E4992A1|nr:MULTISPECIES: methyltransferase domain-containing protein [unclassified Microbacterium]MCE0507463.1 methyltransferase domain-containing protein [Microbacterium sp. KKR3/1]UUE19285.1 methyltransferase domain-containing protein [Microbacterium sp. J1-1]
MSPDLTLRDVEARERMDDPYADARKLARTYGRFGLVNALVSRPGAMYRRDIRPRAARTGRLRILDVGAGGGDLCRLLAWRLRRDGLSAEVTALDADDRAIRWAAAHDGGAGVRYRCALTTELVAAGETYDVVLSNHVLHHLDAAELQGVLSDSVRLAAADGMVAHHDIARSRTAYALFDAATWPISGSLLADSFIREDGLISIRRSYTVAELAAVAPDGWAVRGGAPFRVELRWDGAHARP